MALTGKQREAIRKLGLAAKNYQPACIFCGEADDVVNYKGKKICRKCLQEIKSNVQD